MLEALLLDWLGRSEEELSATRPTRVDLSDQAVLRRQVVAAYWHIYSEHRPEILALRQAAMVDEGFARRLMHIRHAQLRLLREPLRQMADEGFDLPGEPALVASAINAMLEQFCHAWVIEGGEPIGRDVEADEAIDTVAELVLRGIAGRPRRISG